MICVVEVGLDGVHVLVMLPTDTPSSAILGPLRCADVALGHPEHRQSRTHALVVAPFQSVPLSSSLHLRYKSS